MDFELTTQSVMYTLSNSRYKSGMINKTYANVKKDVPAEKLNEVGTIIAGLQDDHLDDVILIQKRRVIDAQ